MSDHLQRDIGFDLVGSNVHLGGKRLGAVQKGGVFHPCRGLTDDEWEYVAQLGLKIPTDKTRTKGVKTDETDDRNDDQIPV